LEKTGVADQISKILIDLYEKPEKVEDAAKYRIIEYILFIELPAL